MTDTQAIEILQQYTKAQGFPHILEALQDIDVRYDDVEPRVQVAFNVFMRLGKKLFSPVEEV